MELRKGTDKASRFTSENFISRVPDNVVTNILDRLPLQDAVKTSILSRNWRFKWTLLTQLVFDYEFFRYLVKRKCGNNFGKIISRFLLHCAMIKKFVLYIEGGDNYVLDDEDINHWILFLSGKGIQDLSLWKGFPPPLKLHAHLFSCLELKHLVLRHCSFDLPVSIRGFSKLLTLEVSVDFENGKFGEFITQCPVLEVLKLDSSNSKGKVKLVEFAKLTNLKTLNLYLCNLDNTTMITSSSCIFELMGYLPKLQELRLDFLYCNFKEGGVEKRWSTTFPCLNTLKLSRIDFGTGMNLSHAFEMISNFPGLQNLEISTCATEPTDIDSTPGIVFPEVDYNKTRLLKLRKVVFYYLKDIDGDVRFIKYLLACSPFLEKFVIYPHPSLDYHGKLLMFAMKLLELHRASPIAEINLYEG